MTTMTIELEQPGLVQALKTIIANMKGVFSVSVSEEDVPNRETRKVIEDARKGKNIITCKDFNDYQQRMNALLAKKI
jgi:hypothetical protein